MINRTLRFWRTIKHLKPIQFYGRLWFLIYKPSVKFDIYSIPRQNKREWVCDAKKPGKSLEGSSFSFLGQQGSLEEVRWDGPQREKLWRYNQHYFDYLISAETKEEKNNAFLMLESWLNEVKPGQGNAWEPYPTSLRVVNWIKWALKGNPCPDGFHASLLSQADFLSKKIEYHLLGNHLFANAKALFFAGVYFEGEDSSKWLDKGRAIIERELREQILDDGGHFELTPMYHAIAYADLLDLCNLALCYELSDAELPRNSINLWREYLAKMRHWLMLMTHPDGDVSFFNDTAIGIAPDAESLFRYHERLFAHLDEVVVGNNEDENEKLDSTGLGYEYLASSGYVKVTSGAMSSILDVAAVGPDYLPGHAHADSLSFELSLGKQRIFVNSGTSCYGSSEERLRQRGTSAHNTVVLNDENSSEVWGGFRVGQRARVKNINILHSSSDGPESFDGLRVEAEHDGYKKLLGKPIHARSWQFSDDRCVVTDRVSVGGFNAYARYHLHPDIEAIEHDDSKKFTLLYGMGHELEVVVKKGEAFLEKSFWHPEFGDSVPSNCLVVRMVDGMVGQIVIKY